MAWTQDRVDILKKLWAEGLSAQQIANQMGEGITRNAVIGKVHRLSLTSRTKTQNNSTEKIDVMDEKTSLVYDQATIEDMKNKENNEKGASIIHLNRQRCKWPIGDPSQQDFYFCGKKIEKDSPYCTEHTQLAYQQPPIQKRRKSSY